jgi:peptide subunit release factor 1 (eRF1)
MLSLTRRQVEVLLDFPAQRDYVVSAYFDMSVQQGFERPLEVALQNMAPAAASALKATPARTALDGNIAAIREALETEPHPTARGLAVFASGARGLRHVIPLEFPVENHLVVDEEPFLLPLLEHRYADASLLVVLFDTRQAHLFEKHQGRPEPAGDLERADASQEIQRDKPRFTVKKRLAATHHEWLHGPEDAHFGRELADAITARSDERDLAGIILLRHAQDTAALRKQLPSRLESLVVAEMRRAMTAGANELNDVVSGLADDWDAEHRRAILAEFQERKARNFLAATGATEVLDALQQGRATQILFGTRRDIPGARCTACNYRFGAPVAVCPYCQGQCATVNAAQDILRMAMRHEVPVVLFREPGKGDPLESAGGVAALVRAGENWSPASAAPVKEEHSHAV